MTTFVLHGGETSREHPENDLFWRRFTTLTSKSQLNILMCYWARPKEDWQRLFTRDSQRVLNHSEKNVSFELVESAKSLSTQLATADVLYVAGGSAKLIEPYYAELPWLAEKLDDKIFIGSSMGAFMVADQYVLSFDSQDTHTVHHGLGLLTLSVLCHWDIEEHKSNKISLLKESNPDLPIITLDECKSITIYL